MALILPPLITSRFELLRIVTQRSVFYHVFLIQKTSLIVGVLPYIKSDPVHSFHNINTMMYCRIRNNKK